ncbi:MAG: beta-galactosidase trimerization domain-containing protein, partial [Bacteroidales bacterium]|nr:beta-galactosidase trimerization domain-containing protein [Bacteroidales bacterium]
DGYLNYFKEKIIRYAVEKVKTDFIHFDNFDYNYPPEADHNPATIIAFRKYLEDKYTPTKRIERFGFDNVSFILPPMWNDPNPAGKMIAIKDPVIQEWIDFRCWTFTTRLAECARFARELNKEIAIEVNPHGLVGSNRAWEAGINHPDLMQYTNVIWTEDTNNPRWEEGVAIGKFRHYKLGRTTNNFIMTYNKKPQDFAENLALNRTIGSLGMGLPEGVGKKYLDFWLAHKELYIQMKGAEKVAVLRSYPSMAYNTTETQIAVNMAEQALQQRQIPFDIIFDLQLDQLGEYYVVVLANQESLSEETIIKIKEFVKNGGGLVATGNTGMYDGWRRLRKENLLEEMLSEIDPGPIEGFETESGKIKSDVFAFNYGEGRIIYLPELVQPEGEIKLGYESK